MGVIQLWPILAPVKEHKPLTSLSGQTLAVDLSIWVCESNAIKQMQGTVVKPHLRNLFFRVSNLTQMGIKLVFAVDGEAPELKRDTMAKRQQLRFSGKQKGSQDMPLKAKSARKGRSRFNKILKECCELLDYLGIPYIYSCGEAEALCALLNRHGFADGCLTDDGDAFLYGAKVVYRNFTLNTKDPHVESYSCVDIRANLGLTQDGLVALAILLGCDYLPKGVPGVGKEQAIKLVDHLQGRNMLDRFKFWQTCDLSELEGIEKNVCKKARNVQAFPNEEVIKEFLVPKDTCPEKELRTKRAWMEKLQDFLYTQLEWPTDYTEEKVLPLLTLWDMTDIIRTGRHHPSIHLVPHKIVKRRVRQGVPCYEVEWNRQDSCYTDEDKLNYRTIEEQEIFAQCFPSSVECFQTAEINKKSSKTGKKKKTKGDSKLDSDVDRVTEKLGTMGLETEGACGDFSQASPPAAAAASCSSPPLKIDNSAVSKNHQERVEDQLSHRNGPGNIRPKEKSTARRKVQESCIIGKKRGKQKTKQEPVYGDPGYSHNGVLENLDRHMAVSTNHDFVNLCDNACLLPEVISDDSDEEDVPYIPLSQRIGLLSLRAERTEGSVRNSDNTGRAGNEGKTETAAVIRRQSGTLSKKEEDHCLVLSKGNDNILNGNLCPLGVVCTRKEKNSSRITLKGDNSDRTALNGGNSCGSVQSPPKEANCVHNHINSDVSEKTQADQTNDRRSEMKNYQRPDSEHIHTDDDVQHTSRARPTETIIIESSPFVCNLVTYRTKSYSGDLVVMNDAPKSLEVEDKLNLSTIVDNVFDTPEAQRAKPLHSAGLVSHLVDIVENLSLNNDSVDLFSTPSGLSPRVHGDVCTPEVVTRCVKQAHPNTDGNAMNLKSNKLPNVLKYSPPEVLNLMTKTLRDNEESIKNSTPLGILSRMEKCTPQTGQSGALGVRWADASTMSHGSPAYGFFNIESSLLNCTGDPCKLLHKDSQLHLANSRRDFHHSVSQRVVLDFTPNKSSLLHLSTSTPDIVKVQTDVSMSPQTPINFGPERLSRPASEGLNDVVVPVCMQTSGDAYHIETDNPAHAAGSEMIAVQCNMPHFSSVEIHLKSATAKAKESSIDSLQKHLDYNPDSDGFISASKSRQDMSGDTFVNCAKPSENLKETEKVSLVLGSEDVSKNRRTVTFGHDDHRSKTENNRVNRDSQRNKTGETGITKIRPDQSSDKENEHVNCLKQSVSKGSQNSGTSVNVRVCEVKQTSSPMALADRLRAKMSNSSSKAICHETVLSVKKIGGLSGKSNPKQSSGLCANVKPIRRK